MNPSDRLKLGKELLQKAIGEKAQFNRPKENLVQKKNYFLKFEI